MRRRGGRFLLGAALGTGIALSITSMHALPTRAFDPGTAEQQLFNLTNQDRTSNGLGALVPDDRLFAIARSAPNQVCGGAQTFSGRAADMIQRGYFSHQIPPCNQYVWPVLDAYGVQYYSAGENIAWNNSPTTTSASDANIAFMNSPEHRANILGDYSSAGMGAWAANGVWSTNSGSFSNVLMYAEDFAREPGVSTVSPPPPPPPSTPPVVGTPGAYQALPPSRILDTRPGSGQPYASSTLGPGGALNVQVAGRGGVPAAGVSAVVLNVTVTQPTALASYVSVYPTGAARPLASNLNFAAGQTIPNLVETPLNSDGQVTFYNATGAADVVADIEGYVYPATGTRGLYQPLQPARLADTRPGSGEPYAGQTPGPRGLVTVQVAGQGGVPATGVSAVVLNVTVTGPTSVGYLTVYPTAAATPLASNLNFVPGQTVANRVIVPLGSNGRVTFYNSAGSTQVIADVSGWFSDGSSATVGGSQFTPTSPSRIADTRVGSGEPFAFNTLTPGSTVAIQVAGVGPVPAMSGSAPPRAVVLNVTATNTTAPGFVSVFPDGTTQPNASDVNWNGGATVPNLVIAKLGSDGAVDFYNNAGAADLVVDLMGWYS